jgi:hypothetical protein
MNARDRNIYTYTAHFELASAAEQFFKTLKEEARKGLVKLDGCVVHMNLPDHLASPIAHDIKRWNGILSPYSKPKKTKAKKSVQNNTVQVKTDINIMDVLIAAVDKHGAKKIMSLLSSYCLMGFIHYTMTMAITLADEKDIENSEAGQILIYVLGNWEKLSKQAAEFVEKRMNDVSCSDKQHESDMSKARIKEAERAQARRLKTERKDHGTHS